MSVVFPEQYWWQRDDLSYVDGELQLAGQPLEKLARSAGAPVFAYSAERVAANLERLRESMSALSQSSCVLFAMKANRFLPILTELRTLGINGIDVCSPEEVRLARQAGFREDQISFTGTSVSNADLDVLALHSDVVVNLDSLSSIRRFGERCPGRKIGLRINPQAGVGYREMEELQYSGEKTTKFGIYSDRFEEALDLAGKYDLKVTGIHLHAGCGFLTEQLEHFREVLRGFLPFLEKVSGLEYVNLGGGLGIPLVNDDEPLDLGAWISVVAEMMEGCDAEIWIEPGDYLVKDAGVLVLEVNTVEEKNGQQFLGVNGGFNLHVEPAFYDLPLHPVACRISESEDGTSAESFTIAGNINEALDIFNENVNLTGIREGDYLAFLNAGGYGASMSSNHCMRGGFREYLLISEIDDA